MSTKIFLTSTKRNTATMVENFVNPSSGKPMNKVKIGRTTDKVQALYSAKVGGLANGLSYKPWEENGKQKITNSGIGLTLQHKMEQKWHLPQDYLHNRPMGKEDVKKGKEQSYYQSKYWQFGDGTSVLDLETMDGELGYYVALDSKYIANSQKEYLSHKFPYALWYISSQLEDEELKYTRNQLKSKAFAALHAKEMTDVVKKKFVVLLGIGSSLSDYNSETLHNLLYDYIDGTVFTSDSKSSNVNKFLKFYNQVSKPKTKAEFNARYLLQQGVDSRVLIEKQGSFTWLRPDGPMVLGETSGEAIEFVLNPKKSSVIEELTEAIKISSL